MTFQLRRILGFPFAIAICGGAMVGAGILRAPSSIASHVSEPWLILALWSFGGLHALLGANVVAELSTSVPETGGIYVPSRQAFGKAAGFLVGYADWLGICAAIAALALASGGFIGSLIPLSVGMETAISVAILLSVCGLNGLGIRAGSSAQKVTSAVKYLMLTALVVLIFLSPAQPLESAPQATSPPVSLLGVGAAYLLIYAAFSGWTAPVYFVEEDRKPESNIPAAMALSIAAVTLLYLALNASLLWVLPIQSLRSSDLAVASALALSYGGPAGQLMAAGALTLALSCLNALTMSAPRILYGLGRDGLFASASRRVNRGGTPDIALAISTGSALVIALTGSFEFVFVLMGVFAVFTMLISDIALFVLRARQPGLSRPFQAIGYPFLPALGLAFDGCLLIVVSVAAPSVAAFAAALLLTCAAIGMTRHTGFARSTARGSASKRCDPR